MSVGQTSFSARHFLGLDLASKQGFIHNQPWEAKYSLGRSHTKRESVVFDLLLKCIWQLQLKIILQIFLVLVKNMFRRN